MVVVRFSSLTVPEADFLESPKSLMKVKENYLDTCFEDYGLKKGGKSFGLPDLFKADVKDSPELSTEASNKFRRALGKLAWLAQTRQDLKV